ncbi:MAG: hypothetical protein ACR652_08040 [Methylocystis sp.]|uniref:hypothetical protein n=1 Tax=Methylocystis sp. TaxID=1911079 RepID=UPI003DA4D4AC
MLKIKPPVCAALLCLAILGATTSPSRPEGGAPAGTPAEIVRLGAHAPARSSQHDPSSRELLESWIAGRIWPDGKRFDQERYEILDRRVVWSQKGRAILHARVLPLDGDAAAFAAKRCPGRKEPLEFQFYFEWSAQIGAWVALAERGTDGFDFCVREPLWTAAQMQTIVAPPPLPAPPKISARDIHTPLPGTPERKAIADALRPAFEALFKAPIEFRFAEMKVGGGFAWVSAHPQRPGGAAIAKSDWVAAVGPCEQDRKDAVAQFWMRKAGGSWGVDWGGPAGVCVPTSAPPS